ncbi:hypothetical protein F5884DRAFT_744165 [Xylogone sp. PMI_703]|nr:hypothetical protein F5884DRAFT_744165 [Xylogone sp. PMI_703]
MSSTSTSTPDSDPQSQSQTQSEEQEKPLLALPPSEGETTTLQVDGASISLDHLGPMVVNQDGTLSRIANWAEMSEIERRNTLRILGKRNQLRLGALRGEGQGEKKE